jgi:hypothetical protein
MKVIPHSAVLSTTNACRSCAINDHGQGASDYPMGGAREEGIKAVRAAEARPPGRVRNYLSTIVGYSGLHGDPA